MALGKETEEPQVAFPIAQVIPAAQAGWNWASPAWEEVISALSLPPGAVCSSTGTLGAAEGAAVTWKQIHGVVWVGRDLEPISFHPPAPS